MYAQFIITRTVNKPTSEKTKKVLELIARIVPQATKQEEEKSSYPDIANRVLRLQSQIRNGEFGESQEEELAKLIGCAIFGRSDDDTTEDVRFRQATSDAAEGFRPDIKSLV